MPVAIRSYEQNCLNLSECVGEYITENNEALQITSSNYQFYVTIPKRYGVLYKFKILPSRMQNETITFRTTYIDEEVEVNIRTGLLRYKDVTAKYTKAYKIHNNTNKDFSSFDN
ncbi:hypothetical protein [Bacillus pseudomycoides]|uniref:hypothetical protein n=1 Tax=Bacillus pseudomycoides TaxID=64104 RepID=UPI000BEBC38F|nr:hypothetical protein [Bacillus pseudomycoides]MED4650826.1 hypothetical protein [Bacillus pseudomycoides]PEE04167.1 hypothetical protein CON86_21705 [Bacillus pseudomycoides]PEM65966.1 hypothetical protein CN632_28580 [Bacillus pseudomycoides]PHC84959.1 hypothetical protein COF63_14500 [Bacillus pseudomycoides]